MILYGLHGISHGASFLMTVMSPDGIQAVIDALDYDSGEIRTEFYPGILPRYHEKVAGGLDRFVARHCIEVLDFSTWTAKKAELGDAIYR